jgi:hypothetical protein
MSTRPNIITDINTLLKIPTKISTELLDKACLCIGSAISDAKRSGAAQVTVEIGIGTLSVDLVDMQCKFVPGKNLKVAIKSALNSEINPLELALEQAFTDKLLTICDEVV